ncbi:MAG: glycosyltransferase family 4 protein [Planctomycetota bacterium]|nr:glycosyltransferase family 4 protein [Planctomycetota bacterium]
MRIVHIITRLIIGGAQENTLLSCEGQHKLGHDVTLIAGPALGPEGSLLERARDFGYRVIVIEEMGRAIRAFADFRTYRSLIGHLRQLKPDVVHTHSSKAGILGRWAARRANVPAVVHTIHGLAFTASTHDAVNWAYQTLERQAAPMTTRIVCVADAMRDQSLAGGIGTFSQYITIYSGMETEPFIHPPVSREETRRRLGLGENHLVIGTIARLFDLKGHDDLIDIAPQLCDRFPQVRFLWVGDGTLRGRLESRIQQLKLRDRFIITGMVSPQRVPELTGAMDMLVHPSRREGLARALPQAALAGKPAITYDIDGAREGVLHEQTGFVLPPFDKQKLLLAIETLAANPPLREKMGMAGREFALRRFDAAVMVSALDRLYHQIAK